MSTHHGVSGYACLGVPGDFQVQNRGEPWQNAVNDPIISQLNAQSHIGMPLSNFNEPWTGGALRDINFNAQPYRGPIFGEDLTGAPDPQLASTTICPVSYDALRFLPHQLPLAVNHGNVTVPSMSMQNITFNQGTQNGDNKVFMPSGTIFMNPNKLNFQGGLTGTGVHPNSDKAGQQTTGNTTRPDFPGSQAMGGKLPGGMSVSGMQAVEPPQLWEMAPPPDPLVLPGEGTGALAPTVPGWW